MILLLYLWLHALVGIISGPSTGAGGSALKERGLWEVGGTYALGDVVQEGAASYISCKEKNTGHKPSTSPEWWTSVGPAGPAGEKGATGEKGLTGEKGEKGTTGEKGVEGQKGEYENKGPWKKGAFNKGQTVTLAGSTWVCIKTHTELEDKEPGTEPLQWEVLAEKGAKGEKGEKGEAGGGEIKWEEMESFNANVENINLQWGVLNGIVYISGEFKLKAEVAAKSIIWTLPAAARPLKEQNIVQMSGAAATQNVAVKVTGGAENPSLLKPVGNVYSYNAQFRLK